jgi:hypothetical protein
MAGNGGGIADEASVLFTGNAPQYAEMLLTFAAAAHRGSRLQVGVIPMAARRIRARVEKVLSLGQVHKGVLKSERLVSALMGSSPEARDRPLIDKTGLKGLFDAHLQFTNVSAAVAQPSDTAGPSLFTAIQEQLGLKFELAKGPVEVIVIGSVQKPGSDVRHRMLRRCNIGPRLALSARRCAEIFARHHLTGA